MEFQANDLRKAMAGMGTDEKKLINIMASVPDAPHMVKLRHTYQDIHRRNLINDLEKETTGWFEQALTSLARGPLLEDARLVDHSIRGAGTKETILNDIVLGRSNADLNAIKRCYYEIYHKDMVKEVREDLSLKTARLFEYVLEAARAEESAPVLPHEVDLNVQKLHDGTETVKVGTNQDVVCHLMAHASDGMIRAMNLRYKERYHLTLDELFKRHFTGHMRDALRLMAARAVDPVKSDADELEESMKGMGTKDELLINRLIKAHWNREHFRQVKFAYKQFYGTDLATRIHGETSGDYRKLLVALCQ
jgi:annexin A7/11